MEIKVKAKDEENNVVFEGSLNRNEVGFLLQYAINDLLAAGVQFHADNAEAEDDDTEDTEDVRFKFPPDSTLN